MPYLRIETNVPKEKIPANFAAEISQVLASSLSKPLEYCSVAIHPGTMLYFGGTDEPCAQVYIMSIGQLGVKENIKHSKAIFAKISKDLGVPATRMYITFDDKPAGDVGYNGTTFHEIFG